MRKWRKRFTYLAFILLLMLFPIAIKDFRWMHLIIMAGIYVILAGGLRLIMSTGQVSFAHAAFWAIGAYASTLFVMRGGVSFWLALPLSGLVGGLVALLIGYPCLRLKGPYFFLVTMAFGEIVRLILTHSVDVFGGDAGISGIPYPDGIGIGGLQIEFSYRSISYYYLMLAGLIVTLSIYYRLERSRFGMACTGIREDDLLSESLGVNAMRFKLTAFVIACALAGMAGSFFAHYITYVSPGFFTFNESIIFLTMVVIGGMESTSGAIIGVVLINLITEFTRGFAQFEIFIYGTALIVVFRFFPGGIMELYGRFGKKLRLDLVGVGGN